jgi:hypothetical protein
MEKNCNGSLVPQDATLPDNRRYGIDFLHIRRFGWEAQGADGKECGSQRFCT